MATTKVCAKCKKTKEGEKFRKWRRQCNACEKEYRQSRKEALARNARNYRLRHLEKVRAKRREKYYRLKQEDPERLYRWNRIATANYRQNNPEKMRALRTDWEKENPDKRLAFSAQRRARKLAATPPWLTEKDFADIEEWYTIAQDLQWLSEEPLHVDHIVPLKGKDVCGLHVPWNLQILDAPTNSSKSNKLTKEGEQLAWTPVSLKL